MKILLNIFNKISDENFPDYGILEMCLSNIKFEANSTPRSHSACTLVIDAEDHTSYSYLCSTGELLMEIT